MARRTREHVTWLRNLSALMKCAAAPLALRWNTPCAAAQGTALVDADTTRKPSQYLRER